MKPLNVNFPDQQKEIIQSISDDTKLPKSQVARAAMTIGLNSISQVLTADKLEGLEFIITEDAKSRIKY